ncbi:MAG TPA: hypothetical protein VKA44_04035 [Gemmatimonadota bacterium]|nr:hypothetical protein [Gemmatimonadota bacterium]
MARVLAYCAGCDSEVAIDLEDSAPGTITSRQVHCLHEEVCRPRDCVLARVPEDRWLDYLEFLPEGTGPGGERGLEASSRIVEMGRRASLAREIRRWILWR